MASSSGRSIDLDLFDFLALGILVPLVLACAKDTFRYVGHCGLVFEEFRFDFLDRRISPFDFLDRGAWTLEFASWVFEVFVFDQREAES